MSSNNSTIEVSESQENRTSYESGEGSRLRGNDHSRSSRSSNSDIALSDNVSSRQHDLHIGDGQGRSQTEESSLNLFSMIRTVLLRAGLGSLYGRPAVSLDNQMNRQEVDVPNQILPVPQQAENAQIAEEYFQEMPADLELHGPSTSVTTQTNGSSNTRRSRMSPFCPCFSPTISDSEDEEPQSHTLSVTDQMRQRLVVSAFAANNPTPPQVYGNNPNVPVVHRVVEYAHHLVPDLDKVYAATYYWGEMDRHKAEQLLEGKPEGTFLLRDSAQTEYLFSVSFRRYQRTLHARIEQGNHRFGFDILDSSVFSSATVTGLIENYKDPTRCLFFEPQLTFPLPRSFPFSLETICRSKIASCTSYGNVASLPLPNFMKSEIRRQHFDVPVRTIVNEH